MQFFTNNAKWCASTSFLAGFSCLFLPVNLCWIPGALLFISGVLWIYVLVTGRLSGIGRFDRELTRGWSSQLSLFFSIVTSAFLVFLGAFLLAHTTFGATLHTNGASYSCYEIALLLAHRYAGYNFFIDENPWTNTAIFVLSLLGTLLLGGLLITTFSNIVQQRKDDVEGGFVTYKGLSEHTVIIGFGNYSLHLAKNILLKDKKRVLVLMTNKNMSEVRNRFRVELPDELMQRLFLLSGEMTSREDIKEKLCIPTAYEVYILGEAKEYGIDSKCIECAKSISDIRGAGSGVLPVYVHLQHLYSNKYIKSADSPSPIQGANNIFLRPFCFYENWGRLLWGYQSLPHYAPLDFEPITENKHVHLVVVGLNNMGAALVLQAARICHFNHFNPEVNRTVISIIERDPSVVEEFQSMYPGLFCLEDVKVQFETRINGDGKSVLHTFESFLEDISSLSERDDTLLTIAICYRDPDQAISAALRLPESVYYQQGRIGIKENKDGKMVPISGKNGMRTQVLIRQEVNHGFGHILDEDLMHYKNFQVFGMFEEGLELSLLDDTLPMLARYNYDNMSNGSFLMSAKKALSGETDIVKTINNLIPKWRCDTEWSRMSNRYQVDMFGTYLKTLNEVGILLTANGVDPHWDIERYMNEGYFILANEQDNRPDGAPDFDKEMAETIAEIEHRRWNAERLIAGWRAPRDGEPRIDAFYIHDNIVPFNKLDDTTKYNDIIVLRAVPLMDAILRKLNNLGK